MSDSLVRPQKYKEIKQFSLKKHLWKNFWSQCTAWTVDYKSTGNYYPKVKQIVYLEVYTYISGFL